MLESPGLTDTQLAAVVEALDSFAVSQIQGFHYAPNYVIRDCMREPGAQIIWSAPDTIKYPVFARQCEIERLRVAIGIALADAPTTALAEAEARGRRQGLEEAAKEMAALSEEAYRLAATVRELSTWQAGELCGRSIAFREAIEICATTPAETQKPETGESLNRLLASAQPTVSRQGNLLMLDCPDGTITDEIFNVLEAACYSSPNRSALAALEGGEQS